MNSKYLYLEKQTFQFEEVKDNVKAIYIFKLFIMLFSSSSRYCILLLLKSSNVELIK